MITGMKRIASILLLGSSVLMTTVCFSQSATPTTNPVSAAVNTAIRNTKKINLSELNYGIVVKSLKTGKILYSHNANRLFIPASVQKLFTATAGLAYLKPDYRFKTEIFNTGTIHNGELNGNLIIKFSGDPFLKSKDLNALFEKVHESGIYRIKGHVYIDNSDYNNIPYPPGWIWDDLSYSYAAPINAIILNRNRFLVHYIPAEKLDATPNIKLNLPPHIANFTNDIRTVDHHIKHCPLTIYSNDQNDYTFHGCLDKRWGEQRSSLAIRNVLPYAKALIKEAMKNNYVKYSGAIGFTVTRKYSHLVATHESPPLTAIIHEMLKRSDNLTTDAVFKKIGEQYFQTQGNWQNSLAAVKKILGLPTGINFKHNRLNDGAGLSRYNLITPEQILKLLVYIEHNPTVRPGLFHALPIAGKDGTLEDRMLDERKSERVHAKTGSMTGVMALAGYIETKHSGNVAFVIMMNNFVGKRRPYLKFEDCICERIANV